MGNAFDMRETVEISGNIGEAIEAHLDEEFGDDVLDFQIYYNDRGEHSVAIALQTGDVVDGGVLLVMPKPASARTCTSSAAFLKTKVQCQTSARSAFSIFCLQRRTKKRCIGATVVGIVSCERRVKRIRFHRNMNPRDAGIRKNRKIRSARMTGEIV
jgi:hypothetical protein